ncbi:TPA: hypothetical protein LEQ12_002495 [Listeria monocytogenes]|uniref:hypothetical protein n=1 Tax=Listeria TaxID=1637 RepID=UPI0001EB7BF0|nr:MULTISPECIES: hypothetical protein [Listeria]EFS02346.1 hypothetical protein NT04LS_2622 [Listeria seeligeri FSL S4-171]EAE6189450.1 hypothetical protein [Listeria monocytogenes]EAK8991763.1 hypothetical protein [Listeria monocytogenes]EAK8994810.1 hypothetical protein [Listeria monocytogenes]EBF5351664.1 hypothetical protein [Listeria monocytogenes]
MPFKKTVEFKGIAVIESGVTVFGAYEVVALLYNPALFDNQTSESYELLAHFIPEHIWAYIFLAMTLFVGVGTLLQAHFQIRLGLVMRMLGLFMAAMITGFFAVVFLFDFPNVLPGVLVGFATIVGMGLIQNFIKRT